MSTREFLIDMAASKLGNYGKGSAEVVAIWKNALDPSSMNEAQIVQFAKTNEWCGGFVLSCLHDSSLLKDVFWKVGSGFVLRILGKHTTKTPKPGDVGIREGVDPHKVYHHFLVERWGGPTDWDSIDGNSPTAARHHHMSLDPTITFYSIDSILPAMPEGGFVRGQEFSVPGIEDK